MARRLDIYQLSLHVLLVVMVVLMVGLVRENRQLRAANAPPPLLAEGELAAPVAVRDLDGREETVRFAPSERESVVLVFTTTCPACEGNLPKWRGLYDRLGGRAEILGVSLDDLAATRAYRDEHDLPFRVVIPADLPGFTDEYAVSGVPLTVLIGRDGKVRNAWLGELSEPAVVDLDAAVAPPRLASSNR